VISLSGYQAIAKIYESAKSLVYRGKRTSDNQAVILKLLKQDYPTPAELTRYKQEYEITNSLNLEGVIRAYDLQKYQNTLVIILEDFGGESLKHSMAEQLKILEFLNLAIKITESLGQIHATNVIHKDINPANIVFNPATGQLKIIDFGISTVWTRENPTLKNPQVLEGTLAYISPEQTGRMNRSLDYRTDFYSLGATFYELLTQQRPFNSTDPMELVHSHLAKQPLLPHAINPEIPVTLSKIVLKLLAKTAEERYQSAWGLKADLEECLNQLRTTGSVSEFILGRRDISDKFQIPQKLYGRDVEINTLLKVFEQVSQGKTEMMLVSGYSGIGKSALVQEIYKPITRARGYFLSGKFDQFQRNIPYSAVVKAFQSLIKQLLTESEIQLQQWREKLLAALGTNGQVIIDVIPEVELIVGKQPPVAELGSAESQNRFNLVFQNFIRVFCQQEHPLVIFLDDLQWVDSATLKLIELMMMDSETRYLLLIGAYRDNEVSPSHPLIMTLDTLHREGAIINEINLAPLANESITQLIAETLHSNAEAVKSLVSLIVRKTGGNPFFVNQFIKTLYQEKLLTFKFPQASLTNLEVQGVWHWNIAQIESMGITDNVVELMRAKLQKLPSVTQQGLRLAACVGNAFDLKTLAIIQNCSPSEAFQDLLPALREGLILPTSELENVDTEVLTSELVIFNYKFLHDRVQQAAYGLIEEGQRKALHLRIGKLLLGNTAIEERTERIFELVDHLNLGRELIADELETLDLVKLNLEAAKKAKDATAYGAAQEYLKSGIESLSGNFWMEHYELALALHKDQAEVEYLNGNFEQSEALIELTLNQAQSALEKAEIYNMLIVQYTLRTQYEQAIQVGKAALAMLDIDLPLSELQQALGAEISGIQANLGERAIASLVNQPRMTIPEKIIATKLLVNLIPTAYLSGNMELYAIVAAKIVNLALQYGHSPDSSHGYSNYGSVFGSVLGNYQSAYEFGLLALNLCEKFNNRYLKCKDSMLFANFMSPWIKHIKLTHAINTEGYQAGLESGELQYPGYILMFQTMSPFFQGVNLEQILAEIPKFLHFTHRTKHQWVTDGIVAFQLSLANLTGATQDKLSFDQEDLSEAEFLASCQEHQSLNGICFYQIVKAIALYSYGEFAAALKSAIAADKLLAIITGMILVADHNFYYSLILAALYPTASEEEKPQYWEKMTANQKQMQIWAENCPENFLHKYLLVAAEMARLSGKREEAIDLCDRAIESAKEYDFIQHEALGNELAAKLWLAKGKNKIAKLYIKEAHYAYQRWGAKRKLEDLESQYPHFLSATATDPLTKLQTTASTASSTDSTHTDVLDLTTVVKASQALAGEIVLDKLLTKLMKIVIENAGAQKGFLILEHAGNWVIEASGEVEANQVNVLQSLPVETVDHSTQIPLTSATIINYVIRTQEDVVLNDATQEGQFIHDAYIIATHPKSILCTPLRHQGKLIGLLYLENNLTSGAFTSDRLEVLKLLSSQVAISIENAQLYTNLRRFNQNLEQLVNERTQELSKTLEHLTATQTKLVESEKMAALGGLVAGVAHEINTPLGIGVTAASLLASKATTFFETYTAGTMKRSDLERFLDTAMQSSSMLLANLNRAAELIQSFKQVAVDQSNEEQRTFKIKTYLEEILLSLRAKLKTTQHKVMIQGDENIIVDSYPGAFSQIVTNLIMNSLLHAYDLEDAGELVIDFKQDEQKVIFEYTDNGKGISPENLTKIFDPFFTTKRGQGGTGLGLHIVYNLVTQKLKGNIQCQSQVGKGTKFIIQFPNEVNSLKYE